MKLLSLSGYAGIICKLHLHVVLLVDLLNPDKNSASDHPQEFLHWVQTWVKFCQKYEAYHAMEVSGLKEIYLSKQAVEVANWDSHWP